MSRHHYSRVIFSIICLAIVISGCASAKREAQQWNERVGNEFVRIEFDAWVSEEEKFNELRRLSKHRAKSLCGLSADYQIVEVKSTKWNSPNPSRISALIKCQDTKSEDTGKLSSSATRLSSGESKNDQLIASGSNKNSFELAKQGLEKIRENKDIRVALVIGNAAYKSAPLDNPVNDATDIANELKRRGFKVITRNNTNLRSLQQVVRDFSDEFKKSDVGLIYYSGHGVETKGQNYLIPVDADIRKEYELSAQAYPASQLTAMMEEVQSFDDKKRVAILILDACRDNPLTRSWRSSGRGLARMDAPAGTFISFSTSPGSVASDGRGRNSPFTKHLLQAIRKPDVPIELMFKQVRVGVMDETKGEQIPWDSSSLTGDFYFSRSGKQ